MLCPYGAAAAGEPVRIPTRASSAGPCSPSGCYDERMIAGHEAGGKARVGLVEDVTGGAKRGTRLAYSALKLGIVVSFISQLSFFQYKLGCV